MILILNFIVFTLQYRTETTILVLNPQKNVVLPNFLVRTIWNSDENYLPDLNSNKEQYYQSNFSAYLPDVNFMTRKHPQTAISYNYSDHLFTVYNGGQNLLTVEQIIQQFETFQTLYLSKDLIIILESNEDQQVNERIHLTRNPNSLIQKIIADRRMEPKPDYGLNLQVATDAILKNRTNYSSMDEFIAQIDQYYYYDRMVRLKELIEKNRRRIDYWLGLRQIQMAQKIYEQTQEQLKDALNQNLQQITKSNTDSIIDFSRYQCTLLVLFIVSSVLVKHLVKDLQESDKDKMV